eukprot:7288227-Prymnesium_polylepis.1
MPGVDLIRFEHLQTLVRSGHAAVLRSFSSLLACVWRWDRCRRRPDHMSTDSGSQKVQRER